MKMNWAQLIMFDVWIKCQTYKIRVKRRDPNTVSIRFGTWKVLCLNWFPASLLAEVPRSERPLLAGKPPASWGFEFCYVIFELLFVSKYLSGVPVN